MIKIVFCVELWICVSIKVEVTVFVNFMFFFTFIKFRIHLSKNNHLFSFFAHFVETNCKKWFSWNFFIRIEMFFFIIVYNFHVFCLYFFYLIKSSNCASWICHLMLLIESTKYEFFSLSTIMSCDNSICLSIRSSFKNCNKLM